MENEIKEAVLSAAETVEGKMKLACGKAFALAEKNNLELLDIARVCNQEGIKIVKCQLGCF